MTGDDPTEYELFEVRVQAALVVFASVLRSKLSQSDRAKIRRDVARTLTYIPERIDKDERLRAYYVAQLDSVFDDLLRI